MPVCETPEQSVVAAVVGGLVGGLVGVSLGFGVAGVAVLAGALGGVGDIAAHALVRDEQFREAVARLCE